MSDWNEVLDARRDGAVEGFHGANTPLEDLDPHEEPAVNIPGPDTAVAAALGAATPAETVAADAAPAKSAPAKRTTARKRAAKKS